MRIVPEWDSLGVRRAALALAREVERRAPELATSKWWKEERHGVFVDYNQNARDRTVASCYSVRPTPDARVSCALDWDEVADVEPGDLRLDTVPARLRERDPAADIDASAATLDELLDLARRDEEGGLGDAPWPPHFPKQKGEPKRVQPSRDADRPTQRGRAGDPQPGGPPPGVNLGGLQRGFGSKPRTGQGHEDEFDDGAPGLRDWLPADPCNRRGVRGQSALRGRAHPLREPDRPGPGARRAGRRGRRRGPTLPRLRARRRLRLPGLRARMVARQRAGAPARRRQRGRRALDRAAQRARARDRRPPLQRRPRGARHVDRERY